MLRTLSVVIFLALYILLLAPPFILHCLLTGSVERLYRVGVAGARLALRLAGIRVRVEGLEHIPAGVGVFVANHTSNADPLAVVAVLPRRVAFLAKKELFRLPILATAFRLGSFVAVDRRHPQAAAASMQEATMHLKSGTSFLIFPEGTRSLDGRLAPFKKGTFVMAIEAGVPIVPISIVGAHKVMPKGAFAIRSGEITVKFHPPVEASRHKPEGKDELLARVHAAVATGLPADQHPLRRAEIPGEDS